MKVKIEKYLPNIYNNITEAHELMDVLQYDVDRIAEEFQLAFNRQTVQKCDNIGLLMFESLLNIYADTTNESLDFRRQRIIERLTMSPPFSVNYLRQQLDRIIGAGLYEMSINYAERTLRIMTTNVDRNWYYELNFLVHKIKPANMVYIFAGKSIKTILVNEAVLKRFAKWNYKLDGSWKLGELPFYSRETEDNILKPANQRSIQQDLLNDSSQQIYDNITKVILNDDIEVSKESFTDISISNGVISFRISVQTNGVLITKYKVMAGEKVYSQSDGIYLPTEESTEFVFQMTYKEGTNG